jgi:hypothetical protein
MTDTSGGDYYVMKKLIIAANLGKVRVLKFRAAGEDPIEQAHLIEEPDAITEVHVETIPEAVTDQAGRFGRGARVGYETGMSYGDEHNLEREMERGALRRIATRIGDILKRADHPAWILAAPQSILAQLEQALPTSARKTLVSSVGADLTQCRLQEMEERFL